MDWKTRLKEEHKQLAEKREKLLIFIGTDDFRALDACEQEALKAQHDVMFSFQRILQRRIDRADAA